MAQDGKRKSDYLLEYMDVYNKEINDVRRQRINEIMSQIHVGSIVYESDAFFDGGAFPQKVIEILDKEQGIIRVYEESIQKTMDVCILHRSLTYEDAVRW